MWRISGLALPRSLLKPLVIVNGAVKLGKRFPDWHSPGWDSETPYFWKSRRSRLMLAKDLGLHSHGGFLKPANTSGGAVLKLYVILRHPRLLEIRWRTFSLFRSAWNIVIPDQIWCPMHSSRDLVNWYMILAQAQLQVYRLLYISTTSRARGARQNRSSGLPVIDAD